MRPLRTLALAALLTSLSIGPSSASAAPLLWVFTGNAHVDCFGCDVPSSCDANLDILGVTHFGTARTSACTAQESSGVLCLVTGTAFGTVTGTSGTATGVTLNFTWTRVGTQAVITITGYANGWGAATFIAPGATCGGPLDATIAGWVAGV